MDKNQAIVDFLINCPQISNNPLFFNFADAKDESKQILTVANDKALNEPYIDGSILKRYTFTIIDYKSIAYKAIVKQEGFPDENLQDFLDTQGIIDWINTQEDAKNYPDFGQDCIIEKMEVLTDNPNLNGVDTNTSPQLARYSLTIRIEYLDKSKMIWK